LPHALEWKSHRSAIVRSDDALILSEPARYPEAYFPIGDIDLGLAVIVAFNAFTGYRSGEKVVREHSRASETVRTRRLRRTTTV
jgi:hypothetical protein